MSQEHLSEHATVRKVVNGILEDKEGRSPVDSLSPDASLTEDLGLDSLDLAEMTVRLEDEYGVDVFEDGVVDRVGEVTAKLDR